VLSWSSLPLDQPTSSPGSPDLEHLPGILGEEQRPCFLAEPEIVETGKALARRPERMVGAEQSISANIASIGLTAFSDHPPGRQRRSESNTGLSTNSEFGCCIQASMIMVVAPKILSAIQHRVRPGGRRGLNGLGREASRAYRL
jgi:hypothetical protein